MTVHFLLPNWSTSLIMASSSWIWIFLYLRSPQSPVHMFQCTKQINNTKNKPLPISPAPPNLHLCPSPMSSPTPPHPAQNTPKFLIYSSHFHQNLNKTRNQSKIPQPFQNLRVLVIFIIIIPHPLPFLTLSPRCPPSPFPALLSLSYSFLWNSSSLSKPLN